MVLRRCAATAPLRLSWGPGWGAQRKWALRCTVGTRRREKWRVEIYYTFSLRVAGHARERERETNVNRVRSTIHACIGNVCLFVRLYAHGNERGAPKFRIRVSVCDRGLRCVGARTISCLVRRVLDTIV